MIKPSPLFCPVSLTVYLACMTNVWVDKTHGYRRRCTHVVNGSIYRKWWSDAFCKFPADATNRHVVSLRPRPCFSVIIHRVISRLLFPLAVYIYRTCWSLVLSSNWSRLFSDDLPTAALLLLGIRHYLPRLRSCVGWKGWIFKRRNNRRYHHYSNCV